MANARSESKKKVMRGPPAKAKKGIDESEKLLVGNGWTIAATQKYLELTTDEERFQCLYQMFTVTEAEYQFDIKQTTMIDLHMSNALYCLDKKFDAAQTQFFCRTIGRLFTNGVQQAQADPALKFDELRTSLFDEFRAAFQEANTNDLHFTPEEAKGVIDFLNVCFLRPLRLVLYPFYSSPYVRGVIDRRKIFRPVRPVPLSECEEIFPTFGGDSEFPMLGVPRNAEAMNLEDMKRLIQQYTDGVINTIERRYDLLEEQMTRVAPSTPH